MTYPLISIIVTFYNQAYYIAKTLESIKLQTYTNWECIIVDDGSEDDSAELIQEFIKYDKGLRIWSRTIKELLEQETMDLL
jgi:glycosyltransferase involved in cell wall biosynthesis